MKQLDQTSYTQGYNTAKMEQQTVTIEIRSAYGVKRFYPVCEKAKTFTHLKETVTLSVHDLVLIECLGFKVITQQPSQDWRD